MILRFSLLAFFGITIGVLQPAMSSADVLDMKSSQWKFQDDPEAVGDDWISADFDDKAWKTGTAPFGYGDDDTDANEKGKLSYGTDSQNKRPLAYLRHTVDVEDPEAIKGLHGKFFCDDGCVIFLNGKEIHRFNLPEGKITKKSRPLFPMGGELERYEMSFLIKPDQLKQGENQIAVQLHQANASSSDLAFDASLSSITEDDALEQVKSTMEDEAAALSEITSQQ